MTMTDTETINGTEAPAEAVRPWHLKRVSANEAKFTAVINEKTYTFLIPKNKPAAIYDIKNCIENQNWLYGYGAAFGVFCLGTKPTNAIYRNAFQYGEAVINDLAMHGIVPDDWVIVAHQLLKEANDILPKSNRVEEEESFLA